MNSNSPSWHRALRLLGQDSTQQRLVLSTMFEAMGLGVFVTTSIFYLTVFLHLPAVPVATAMTAAGIVGLVVGTPLGSVADRVGIRPCIRIGLAGQALGAACLLMVDSVLQFAIVMILTTLCERLSYAARSVLIAEVFAVNRVAGRARIRAFQNVGLSVGGSIGALVLAWGTQLSYTVGFVLNGAVFLVSLVLLQRLAATRSARRGPEPAGDRQSSGFMQVQRDGRFLRFAFLNALVSLHYGIFEVGVPLWVATGTDAPAWVVGVSYVLNSIFVILLQVRVSARVTDLRASRRMLQASGFLILAATAVYSVAGRAAPGWAVAIILLGTTVYVFGEMAQAAASWAISYELAPEDRMGEYQSAFASAANGGIMLAPLVVVTLVQHGDAYGLPIMGAAIAIFCLLTTAALANDRPALAKTR